VLKVNHELATNVLFNNSGVIGNQISISTHTTASEAYSQAEQGSQEEG